MKRLIPFIVILGLLMPAMVRGAEVARYVGVKPEYYSNWIYATEDTMLSVLKSMDASGEHQMFRDSLLTNEYAIIRVCKASKLLLTTSCNYILGLKLGGNVTGTTMNVYDYLLLTTASNTTPQNVSLPENIIIGPGPLRYAITLRNSDSSTAATVLLTYWIQYYKVTD